MSLISCNKFTDYLVAQEPIYDKLILEDVRPTDGFSMGYFESGQWDAYDGVTKRLDRFNNVFPDLTHAWNDVTEGSCVGTPCDPEENRIGMGNTRIEYSLEQQSWATDLFCFDEWLHVNKAKENIAYVISDILRPSTIWITSNFLRKRAAETAGKKWLADANMTDFTWSWEGGPREVYMNTSGSPTSKLSPQMLQRRVQPLINLGYLGKNIKDSPMMLEFCTDLETLWDMNRNVDAADASTMLSHWRFMEFDAKSLKEYWKYGWAGQIGNYMVNVDFFPLRFNKVGTNRFQVVYPLKNIAATNGIKSTDNDDYHNAQYQFSYIRHRRALQILTFNAAPINPEMPFLVRDYGGRWRFVMDNLGADRNGCVIENKRRNKGQFIADYQLAIRPQYTEWLELVFHKREPACVTVIDTCNADPGYPEQYYESSNDPCPDTATLYFSPEADDAGNYVLAADSITCNGVPQDHAAISEATLGALATAIGVALNPSLGSWSEVGDDVQIQLEDSTCSEVVLPWVT